MLFDNLKSASGRILTSTIDFSAAAARTSLNAVSASARFTFNAVGKGVTHTLDGLEYVDKSVDTADQKIEDAMATAGSATAGVFHEKAKPHGDRAGRMIYKFAKFGLNFVPVQTIARDSLALLRHLRR